MKTLAILFTLIAFALPAAAQDADRAALLKDVRDINTSGIPGGISVFGPQAFPVVAGTEGKDTLLPVIGAARLEQGRIVAFGHEGFMISVDQADTARLVLNSIRWAAPGKPDPRVALISVYGGAKLLAFLRANGIAVTEIPAAGDTELGNFDVIFVNAITLTSPQAAVIEQWVRHGGGLLTGVTGWGWVQVRAGGDRSKLATHCPGNLMLKNAGLVFSASTPARTLPRSYSTTADLTLVHAGNALDALLDHTSGKTPLPASKLLQCGATLGDALRSMPPDDTLLRPRLDALSAEKQSPASFTQPIDANDVLRRLLLTRDIETARTAKPEAVKAHESSRLFPGSVEPYVRRLESHKVRIDAAVPQWHGTGLYAPPGEVIRVSIAPEYASKGFAIRIGCHTDTLWHLDAWRRAPDITRREALAAPVTSIASAFGGLVYIDVPPNLPLANIEVVISGAVESPRFILGETKVDDWQSRIRNLQAPWGELETKKIILSMPAGLLKMVDDPQSLLEFWDKVLDAEADLATIPRDRRRPERIVTDLQISAGYMHSGYPVMTPLDESAETALTLEKLSKGSWGHFHELGHNHQTPDWTFDGTVEVTCNLFSLYVTETLCGNPPDRGHPAMQPEAVAERLRKHLAQPGDRFERWKKDPFLALIMYDQLRAGFGWDTYKKVFAGYRALPKEARPKNDDEKRDQWLLRFSRAAGKNLGPFFEAWGVPTSETARASLKDLPSWMPADWPKP